MKVKLHVFTLPLKETFKISHTQRSEIQTVIVELSDGGMSGYGEAPLIDYYGMSASRVELAIKKVEGLLNQHEFSTPKELWGVINGPLKNESFTLCAVDQAAHDLFGKIHSTQSMSIWNLRQEDAIRSNYTIGLSTPEEALAAFNKEPNWPIYKVKLGNMHDIEVVEALRSKTNAAIRVDANQAWSAEETIENSQKLALLNVEYIEQPMPINATADMKVVREASALPLIADESCQIEEDVQRCAELFHGINIKLTKCGGMTPAKRMIDEARRRGIKVMMGCMTESTVGISAIAQMTPLLDYVDMDGAYLLAKDVATGSYIQDDGNIRFPACFGNGVALTGRDAI